MRYSGGAGRKDAEAVLQRRIPWVLMAALVGALGASPASAQNRLFNPGFDEGMNGWEFQLHNDALAFPNSSSGALCTSFADGGLAEGDVLLLQRLVPLAQDAVYRLRFTASADASRSIVAHVGGREEPFATYKSSTVNLTTVPQVFESVFTMSSTSDPCAILVFRLGGQGNVGVCIDDVVLEEITPPPPGPPPSPVVVPPAAPEPLRLFAQALGFEVGTAVRPEPLFCEDDYAQVLGREYNQVTPELDLTFSTLRPEFATFSFRIPDAMVDFAEQRGMAVYGHTLVWGEALPPWLTEAQLGPAQAAAVLQNHIQNVVGHYAGRMDAWNVVNEAIDYDGSLRDTLWLQTIGPDYIDQAFQWAHEADPDARLIYNDFQDEGLGVKSDGVFALVQGMVQRGVPIDGVGFQAHLELGFPHPSREEIAANMDRYAALGIDVYITEMDVTITGTPSEADLVAQAAIYEHMMHVCVTKPNCHALVTWGFTDKHSWVPELVPGAGSALPFDANYAPKPAYYALRHGLSLGFSGVPSLSLGGRVLLAVGVLGAALWLLRWRGAASTTGRRGTESPRASRTVRSHSRCLRPEKKAK
jgi:endo-1,4-beta-xylanase